MKIIKRLQVLKLLIIQISVVVVTVIMFSSLCMHDALQYNILSGAHGSRVPSIIYTHMHFFSMYYHNII